MIIPETRVFRSFLGLTFPCFHIFYLILRIRIRMRILVYTICIDMLTALGYSSRIRVLSYSFVDLSVLTSSDRDLVLERKDDG
jgi:hypothetical protein